MLIQVVWRIWWRGGRGGVGRRTRIWHLRRAVIWVGTNVFNNCVADFIIDFLVLNSNCNMTDFLLTRNALLFWHLLIHNVALSVDDGLTLVHNLIPVLGHIDHVALKLRHLLAFLPLPSLKPSSLTFLQREKSCQLFSLSFLLFLGLKIISVVKIIKVLITSGLADQSI